jgi:hypothetical protein
MVIIKARRPPDPGPDRSMVFWTRAVGVFTMVLALVAVLQFWAFVQSERAFLSIANVSIDGGLPKAGDPTPHLVMQIKNGGRNTAFIDRVLLDEAYGLNGPLSQKPGYKDEAEPGVPPPIPADTIVPRSTHLPKSFTQDEIDAIKAGKNRFALFGYITYTDTFWLFGSRTTGFCYTYSPDVSQLATCPERAYTYVK